MALDSTNREANVWDSIKKYFVDNFTGHITFDKALATPNIQGREVDKWISLVLGPCEFKTLSDLNLQIFVCSRQDNEWFKNAQLKDNVMELLVDETQTDGMRRIPFYASHPTDAWVSLGALLVQEVMEGGRLEAEDETKFKILNVRLRTASKV